LQIDKRYYKDISATTREAHKITLSFGYQLEMTVLVIHSSCQHIKISMLQLHCVHARVCIFIFMGVVLYAIYCEKLMSNRVGI